MANYPLTPVLISTLDVTQPSATEDASKLADAIRQVKSILGQVLLVSFNDDGTLKSVSNIADASITTNMLQDLSVTAAKIALLAVDSPQLKDAAVATAKLADACVTLAKMATGSVDGSKIVAAAIVASHLAVNAVTSTALLNHPSDDSQRAVGTDHIKDGSVTTPKIADLAVTPAKISNIGPAKLIVGDGVSAVAADVGGVMTATLVGNVLTFSYGTGTGATGLAGVGVGTNSALIVEKGPYLAVGGGDGLQGVWQTRPVADATTVFAREADPSNLVTLAGQEIIFNKPGIYALTAFAICTTGRHMTRWFDKTGNQVSIYGVSGGQGGYSFIRGAFQVSTTGQRFLLQHFFNVGGTDFHSNNLGAPPIGIATTDVIIYAKIEVTAITFASDV